MCFSFYRASLVELNYFLALCNLCFVTRYTAAVTLVSRVTAMTLYTGRFTSHIFSTIFITDIVASLHSTVSGRVY